MKKQPVPAGYSRPRVGSATGTEEHSGAKAPAATLATKPLDLSGFDLTDFARFLRATDPEWVNGATERSWGNSITKR